MNALHGMSAKINAMIKRKVIAPVLAEGRFLRALVAMNLASAMEYRASFLTQIIFMFINNGIYFIFWLLFFDRFGAVRGYQIDDIYLLFAVVALGFGIGSILVGNAGSQLAYLIAQGRLDYYLVLPRTLITHVVFSRMGISAIGDVAFGLLAYSFTGRFAPIQIMLFLVAALAVAAIHSGYATMAGSLAFFIGNAQYASTQMTNALLTFGLYPHTLFSGMARFLLYTLLPAMFVGAVPVMLIQQRNLWLLLGLLGVAAVTWAVAAAVFYYGLRRYESGSAINVNV